MYLNVHSHYSLLYGTASVEALVDTVKQQGYSALSLTDINNTTGAVEFVFECRKKGLTPIVGVEFRNGDTLLYVALARSNKGLSELNTMLTKHNADKTPYPERAPEWDDVFVIYPYGTMRERDLRDYEFLGVRLSQLHGLYGEPRLDKMVVLQPSTFLSSDDYELHRCMRAIDNNELLSRLSHQGVAAPDELLLPPQRLHAAFALYPQLLSNTERLISCCEVDFDAVPKNKKTFTGTLYDDYELLRKLAFDGMLYRYGPANKEAYRRIDNELDIIDKMGFCSYFLMAWDVVRYAMSSGFHHVGRGSGANSVVAYCLKITDVDPIGLDLYFERFLNPRRSTPPDFDLDFSWRDRDVIHEYMLRRYGRRHAALLGLTVTLQGRAVCRELGKIYGLTSHEIEMWQQGGALNMSEPLAGKITSLASRMIGMPLQRSVHAGGVLISEDPMCCYAALDFSSKGLPVTQWDMNSAELLGYEKIDILSQRGIGHLHDAVELVRSNRGIAVDIHRVEDFKSDERVRRQLMSGETNGCFYIESPAMRGLLRKLHCSDYKTLVAASSIIRPGVARSGMMREYVKRHNRPDEVTYPHPMLETLLKETYGVMVYQEDVLKICHHFAGLDLADADVLRRMMSRKRRDEAAYQSLVQRFFDNCRQRGYPESLTSEIWRQIESFAGYSFSKAHSASYAVESYQSLFMKAYYPLEFQVAVINNFGGYYHTWVYFNEARRQGAILHLPCVNRGQYYTSLEGRVVIVGFVHVQGLEADFVHRFIEERSAHGPYVDLADFMSRTDSKVEQTILLIRCGAFSFTGRDKAMLLWEAYGMRQKRQMSAVPTLFHLGQDAATLPDFKTKPLEHAYDELELLGFPVTLSCFDMLQTRFRGEVCAEQMMCHLGESPRMLGQLVTLKPIHTTKGDLMYFATFIDVRGEFFDTVHFPDSLGSYPFRGQGVYLLKGKIVEEFGHPTMEVEKMAKMPYHPNPRSL